MKVKNKDLRNVIMRLQFKNFYREIIIMKKNKALLNFILITFSMCIIFHSSSASINNNETIDTPDQRILARINAYRFEYGLKRLTMDKFMSEEARIHSIEMARNKIPFGHDGFKGRMHKIFEHFSYPTAIAENVAMTGEDAEGVIKLWLHSPGHRKNIEGNYNLTGIGIARDENSRVYVTQIFLRAKD